MTQEQLRMQMLAGIITESQYKEKLNEEVDIAAELSQYYTDNPINDENYESHFVDAKEYILSKFDRPLTPLEKGKITRTIDKYGSTFIRNRYSNQRDAEDKVNRERYLNNLLPLRVDNWNGTPSSEYYEYANTYDKVNPDGSYGTLIRKVGKEYGEYDYTPSHSDPKSGYTDYQLRAKWIDTPVDQATLNKYWHPGKLSMLGLKK